MLGLDPPLQALAVATRLASACSIVVATHVRPDGDAWSSALGLSGALRRLGIDSTVVSNDPIPDTLAYLDGSDAIQHIDVARSRQPPDVLVLVDCATPDRAGLVDSAGAELWPSATLVVIDHHENPAPAHAFSFIEASASAAAELVYEVVRALGVAIDPALANTLLTGMVTDTASFQLSTTTPSVLRRAASLLEAGGDMGDVSGRLYRSRRWQAAAIWGRVLSSLELADDRQVASITLRQIDRQVTGGVDSDLDGRAAYLLGIHGVRIGLFFREEAEHRTRVSIRTQHGPDALAIARQFGGGGHRNSAGCTLDGLSLDEHKVAVQAAARDHLNGR